MIYRKNLPLWERGLRTFLALVLIGLSLWLETSSLLQWIMSINAIVLVVTGFFGYCPACHLMGRKPQ